MSKFWLRAIIQYYIEYRNDVIGVVQALLESYWLYVTNVSWTETASHLLVDISAKIRSRCTKIKIIERFESFDPLMSRRCGYWDEKLLIRVYWHEIRLKLEFNMRSILCIGNCSILPRFMPSSIFGCFKLVLNPCIIIISINIPNFFFFSSNYNCSSCCD